MSETEVQPAPEAGAGNDDVRAVVAAAFEQHSKPDPGETPPETAAAGDEHAPASERVRNERGQFTKADSAVPGIEAPKTPDADLATDKPVMPSPAGEPPKSWSAEAKLEWSKLSPATQQAVIKREAEIDEGGRRWSEEKRGYEAMLAPVVAQAKAAGIQPKEGLDRLLAANDYLERDPEAALRWLANAYGVDLSKPPSNDKPATPVVDPAIAQLRSELSTIKGTLEEQSRSETRASIQKFASDPSHEHFESVKQLMGHLLATGQATDMQDAYDKAVWATPDIRSKLIEAQTSSLTKRVSDQEAATKARRAAISISGSPAGAPAAVKPEYDTVDAAVRAAFRQHAG